MAHYFKNQANIQLIFPMKTHIRYFNALLIDA